MALTDPLKENQLRVAQNKYARLTLVSNSKRTRPLFSFTKHITINLTWTDTIRAVLGRLPKVFLSIVQLFTPLASTIIKVIWAERAHKRIPTLESKTASKVASLRAQAVCSTEWITSWCLTQSLRLIRAVCISITISFARVNSCTLMKAHSRP